ncbi:MAG TPA: DUF222 domain-containing protein [Acidimicrobiales bacterium]|nr:DUF222 domain-containing protein [Acidimicrobiales bacterium]
MAMLVTHHSEGREQEANAIEEEMAQVCGTLNAAAGRLVSLIARALDSRACEGTGIHSPEQWVAWKCGVSAGRARRLVAMARRLPQLPETASALRAGELSEDQVSVVCRHAPAYADAEVATLARQSTVSQLTRTLRRYAWAPDPEEDDAEEGKPEEAERREVGFGTTEEGAWRLSAILPPDQGALVERALDTARRALIEEGQLERPTWADALLAMADRSLGAAGASRPHHDRHLIVVHLRGESHDGHDDNDGHAPHAHVHGGPPLPDALRRLLGCDGRVRPMTEVNGVALSVGRTQRIVPERTRMAIEERDGACRVPGCERSRWLQVHHVTHWEDGGATDTANLVALCSLCGIPHKLHYADHRIMPNGGSVVGVRAGQGQCAA